MLIPMTSPPQPAASLRTMPCGAYEPSSSRVRMGIWVTGQGASGQAGHHPREAAIRQRELRRACEQLAYQSSNCSGTTTSGMAGWGLQHRENAFCGVPVEHAASRIAQFIDRYRPQVVVTYDPDSTRHPDHVRAARAATSAVDAGHVVAKLYYKAHGSSHWQRLNRALAEVGIQRAAPSGETLRRLPMTPPRERPRPKTISSQDCSAARVGGS